MAWAQSRRSGRDFEPGGARSERESRAVHVSCHGRSEQRPQDYLRQSPGARAVPQGREANDFGLGDSHVSRLLPYPRPCLEGMRTPFDIWRYAGKGVSSWGSPQLRMPFSAIGSSFIAFRSRGSCPTSGSTWTRDTTSQARPSRACSCPAAEREFPHGPVAGFPRDYRRSTRSPRFRPEEIKQRRRVPLQAAGPPAAEHRSHALSQDVGRVSSRARAYRRRLRHPRRLPARVPAALVPDHSQRTRRCERRPGNDAGQLLRDLRRPLTAEQMEGLKELLRPTPDDLVQPHRAPRDRRAERRRELHCVPRERSHQRGHRADA